MFILHRLSNSRLQKNKSQAAFGNLLSETNKYALVKPLSMMSYNGS